MTATSTAPPVRRRRASSPGSHEPQDESTSCASAPETMTTAGSPRPGIVLDRRYLLRREIAGGGGGHVFEAEHLVSGRRVAVKLIPLGEPAWAERRLRLLHEARALVAARHPSVVELLDAGADDQGVPYLVMELLEGRSLAGLLAARRQLPPSTVARLGIELCRILEHVHRRRVLHRDIKPSNVFLTRTAEGSERLKLIDFGIALRLDMPAGEPRLTLVGSVPGTVDYLPLERLLGQDRCGAQLDVYSLGVLLFECLTGGVPFEGGPVAQLAQLTRGTPAPHERNPLVPRPLSAVVARAIALESSQRYPDMRAFGAALTEALPSLEPHPPLQLNAPPVPSTPTASGARTEAAGEARRRHPRAPYVTPLRILLPDGTDVDGRSEDLSEGGMLALVPRRFETKERLRVRFALPVSGRVATVFARARWGHDARRTAAVGLEFEELGEDHREVIGEYVKLMRGD